MPALMLCDTDRVKQYVFGSYKLREVRGASAILDHLNRFETKALLNKLEAKSCLYSFGGATMGRFSSLEKAQEAIRALEYVYREKSAGGASITGSAIEWDGIEGEPFREKRRELALKLRLSKGGRVGEVKTETFLDIARFCHSCGGVPATNIDQKEPLCEACHCKRQRTRRVKNEDQQLRHDISPTVLDELESEVRRLSRWSRAVSLQELTPDDLNAIGDLSTPKGYLGFIYVDANSLGQVLQGPGTVEELIKLAEGVDARLRRVTYDAIGELLPPARRGVLPFEIILLGGDDLVLVTVADKALAVVHRILKDFVADPIEGNPISLSAAVILAHDSFPMASFFRLASEGLNLAKRRCVEDRERFRDGAIDFAVISGSGAHNLGASRDRDWRGKPVGETELFLTARPYGVAAFGQLQQCIGAIKSSGFPRSRLHFMYESLFRSLTTSHTEATVAACEVLGRLNRLEVREALIKFFETFSCSPHPWHRDARQAAWTTPLLDLVELWDFVPADVVTEA